MNIVMPKKRFDNELTGVSQPFDFNNPPFDPREFAEALGRKMIEANGVGLAAIQVAVPYRIFAVRTEPTYVCFNPKVVDMSGAQIVSEEGCLSFPGMWIKVKRYDEVRLRFQTHDGKFITRKFAGFAARVVQHELDHCDGILFYNRASSYHRDVALRKWERGLKKLNTPKKEEAV